MIAAHFRLWVPIACMIMAMMLAFFQRRPGQRALFLKSACQKLAFAHWTAN